MPKWNLAEDVEGECNAHMYIGDDYGDGSATFRCQLPEGHVGKHYENFVRGELIWAKDERDYNVYEDCENCEGEGFIPDKYEDCKICDGWGKFIVDNIKDLQQNIK